MYIWKYLKYLVSQWENTWEMSPGNLQSWRKIWKFSLQCFDLEDGAAAAGWLEGHSACKQLDVGLLVMMIWLELCMTYSSSSPVVTTTSIILCFNRHRLTQFHLENGKREQEKNDGNVIKQPTYEKWCKIDLNSGSTVIDTFTLHDHIVCGQCCSNRVALNCWTF